MKNNNLRTSNKAIISRLFKPAYEKDNAEWQDYLKAINDKILWYPSAGADFSHFQHLANGGINGLYTTIPTIIHSDVELCQSFFKATAFEEQNSQITINWRLPIAYVNMLDIHEFNGRFPVPPPPAGDEKPVHSNIFKPLSKKQIREREKKAGVTLDEIMRAPKHNIWLFNCNITTPDNIDINNQYVLYFFWDNIQFIDRILTPENLFIDGILSKHDLMAESKRLQFWKYLNEDQRINNLICDYNIFGGMEINGDDPMQVAYQGNMLVNLKHEFEYQWDEEFILSNYRFQH